MTLPFRANMHAIASIFQGLQAIADVFPEGELTFSASLAWELGTLLVLELKAGMNILRRPDVVKSMLMKDQQHVAIFKLAVRYPWREIRRCRLIM